MIFHIALKDLKVICKDKKALIILLLMPALIMLILGTALSSAFISDTSIKRFPVAVVNKDDGPMSGIFINMVMGSKELSKMFNTFDIDENEADNALKKKTIPVVIIIPENFSKNINNSKDAKIEIKSNADDKIKSSIVESTVGSYFNSTSMCNKGANAIIETFGDKLPLPSPVNGFSGTSMLMVELQNKIKSEVVKFKDSDQEKAKSVSAIQYYSAAMLVMFLLFSAMEAIGLMMEERENRTLNRIIGTGVSRAKLVAGKCLGLLLIGGVQAMILIVFTHYAYKVDWGSSLPGIILITICSVFACAGLGMFVAAICRTLKAANAVGSTLVQVLTVFGGGMVPIYVLPDVIKKVSNITPNWQVMDGYYKLMQGFGTASIISNCLVLTAMGVVFLGIGILKFRTV